jgi:hypothetical protein
MPTDETHHSAVDRSEHVAAPIDAETAVAAVSHGPRGTLLLLLAGISGGLLLVGWLLFHFSIARGGFMSTDQSAPNVPANGTTEHHMSPASTTEQVAAPIDPETAAAFLSHGPRGALLLAGISVGLLFIGWLLFYFVLFIPRGPVG